MEIAVAAQKRSRGEKKLIGDKCERSTVKNDQAFFEQLIAPIQHRMMRSIWKVVRNTASAEDTFQEALISIWRKRKRIREHPKPDALILKICLNAAYDNLRKSKHHLKNLSLNTLSHDPISEPGKTGDRFEMSKVEAEILAAMGRLPRSQALAVLMRVVQGQSYTEISETLGCKETTARIHVSRGRVKLSYWLSHLLPASHPEKRQ